MVQQSAPPFLRGPQSNAPPSLSDSNRSEADALSARLAAFNRQLSASSLRAGLRLLLLLPATTWNVVESCDGMPRR